MNNFIGLPSSHVERANVKRQLTLERRHGGRQALSDRTGIAMENLKRYASKRGKPTAALALALARFAGVSVEAVLSGAWPVEGACSR